MDNREQFYETSIRDLLRIFFEKINILAVTIIFVLLTVFIGLKFVTPKYDATTKILISGQKEVESPYYRELMIGRGADIVMTQSEIVKSKPVLERTVRVLELDDRMPTLRKYNSWIKNAFVGTFDLVKTVVKGVKGGIARIIKKPQEEKETDFQKTIDALKKNIKVKRILDTDVFTITVSDYDAQMAQKIANVLSRSYILFDLEQQLAEMRLKYGNKYPMVLQLEDNIGKMNSDLHRDLDDINAIGPASVKIIEQAVKPSKPSTPKKMLIFSISIVLGVILGLFLIVVYAYFDQSFKSPKDLENFIDIPLLGSLPLIRQDSRFSKERRSKDQKLFNKLLRILSDQFYLVVHDKKIKTVMFTSVDKGEGTTHILSNLAKVISKTSGFKTLIVDCNLRSSDLSSLHNAAGDIGFAQYLEGKDDLSKCIKKIGDNLWILPAGKTELNPLILFNSTRVNESAIALKDKFDLILFDVPDIKEFKDAYLLYNKLDAAVFVVDMDKARRQIVKMYIDSFEAKDKIMGLVFNKRIYHIPEVMYKHF